ncbi:hypothetical protein WMF30_19550 [Sorangium sp. So ce134]
MNASTPSRTGELDPRRIRARFAEGYKRYGKVALLVDDAPDAESRVSRELYGSEDLPDWWFLARSLECAAVALSEFQKLFEPQEQHRVGILLMDRYLPARCPGGHLRPWDTRDDRVAGEGERAGSTKPDDAEAGWRATVQKCAVALRTAAVRDDRKQQSSSTGAQPQMPDAGFLFELVTSYEHTSDIRTSDIGSDASFTWRPRRVEPIRQLRDRVRRLATAFDQLLYRGPAPRGERGDAWMSQLRSIKELWMDASPRPHVILVTGAGVSEARGRYGPGLPRSKDLPTNDRSPSDPDEGRSFKRCLCEEPRDAGAASLDAARVADWILSSTTTVDDYRRLCRRLHRFDRGFSHHHWLLARLPWDAIITTSWDGFHERAALAASQEGEHKQSNRCIRLGTPAEWKSDSPSVPDRNGYGKLYKVYDGLVYPGTNLDEARKIHMFVPERLLTALQEMAVAPSAIVAVGLNRRDSSDVLRTLSYVRPQPSIFWVSDEDAPPKEQGAPPITHLRGTAADFAFDLFRLCQVERR